jgi:hypothetical protein
MTDRMTELTSGLLARAVLDDRVGLTEGGPDVAARPHSIDGLVVMPMSDAVVFEGAARRQVLRGRDATSMIPRLIRLLDGTRTADDVATSLPGVPPGHVRKGLALLWSLGLVEDAAGPPVPADADPALAGCVRRLIGTRAGHRRTGEILCRLSRARVLLVGDDLPVGLLARHLDGCVGEVETRRPPTDRGHREPPPDLIVLVDGGVHPWGLRDSAHRWSKAGVSWLRTAMTDDGGEIGPLVRPDDCACHRSFRTGRGAGPRPELNDEPATPLNEAWAALVAIEVLHIIAGIGASVSAGRVVRYDLGEWEQDEVTIPHHPACPSSPHPRRGPVPGSPSG